MLAGLLPRSSIGCEYTFLVSAVGKVDLLEKIIEFTKNRDEINKKKGFTFVAGSLYCIVVCVIIHYVGFAVA